MVSVEIAEVTPTMTGMDMYLTNDPIWLLVFGVLVMPLAYLTAYVFFRFEQSPGRWWSSLPLFAGFFCALNGWKFIVVHSWVPPNYHLVAGLACVFTCFVLLYFGGRAGKRRQDADDDLDQHLGETTEDRGPDLLEAEPQHGRHRWRDRPPN